MVTLTGSLFSDGKGAKDLISKSRSKSALERMKDNIKAEEKNKNAFEKKKSASHEATQALNMKEIADRQKMVVDSDKRGKDSKGKSNFLEEVPYERGPDFVDKTEGAAEEEVVKKEVPSFPKNLGLYQKRMVSGRYYGDPKTGKITRLTSKPREDGKFDVAAEWLTKKVGTDDVSGHGSVPLYRHISDVDPFAEGSTYVPLTQDEAMALVEDAGITPLGRKLIGGIGDKKLFSLDNLLLDNTGRGLEWADDIGDDARSVGGSKFGDELGQRSFIKGPTSDISGVNSSDVVNDAQHVGAKKEHVFPESEYDRKVNALNKINFNDIYNKTMTDDRMHFAPAPEPRPYDEAAKIDKIREGEYSPAHQAMSAIHSITLRGEDGKEVLDPDGKSIYAGDDFLEKMLGLSDEDLDILSRPKETFSISPEDYAAKISNFKKLLADNNLDLSEFPSKYGINEIRNRLIDKGFKYDDAIELADKIHEGRDLKLNGEYGGAYDRRKELLNSMAFAPFVGQRYVNNPGAEKVKKYENGKLTEYLPDRDIIESVASALKRMRGEGKTQDEIKEVFPSREKYLAGVQPKYDLNLDHEPLKSAMGSAYYLPGEEKSLAYARDLGTPPWFLRLISSTKDRTRKGKPGDRRAENEVGASPIKMMSNLGGKKFYDLLARQSGGGFDDEITEWLKGSGYDIADPAQKDQIIEFFNNLAENARSMAKQRFESDTISNDVRKTLQAFSNAEKTKDDLQQPAANLAAAKAAVNKSLQFDTSEHEKKIRDIAARIAVSNIIDSVPGAREKMDPADIERMIQLMADNKMEGQFITAGERVPGLVKAGILTKDPQRGWGFMNYYDKYKDLFETHERKAQVEQELDDLVKQGLLSTEPRDSNAYNNAYSERMSALTGAPGRTYGITRPGAAATVVGDSPSESLAGLGNPGTSGRSTMDRIIDYLGGNLNSEWTPAVQEILGRYAKGSDGKVVSDRQQEINELRELIKFMKEKDARLQNKRRTLDEALAEDKKARNDKEYHNLEGTGARDLAEAAKKRLAKRLRRYASGGIDRPRRVFSNDDIIRSKPIAEMIADRMK